MFWKTLLISLRYLFKQRSYALINILGLTTGLATCIIIFLFIQYELSYDTFHKDADNIYRVETKFEYQGENNHWAASQGKVIPELTRRYPEVIAGLKIHKLFNPPVFNIDDKYFREKEVLYVDSTFFEIFTFEVIYGDKSSIFNDKTDIVLTETTAGKFFGKENPVGKILTTDIAAYKVVAVVKDPPPNSHFHFSILLNMSHLRSQWPGADEWGPMAFYSYIKTKDKISTENLKSKIDKDIYDIYGYVTEGDSANVPEGMKSEFFLNPIKDIHLYGHAEKEIEDNSDAQYVNIFSLTAIFILIIACINYMNLATARAAQRTREVGMRKILGAFNKQIFYQFISESYLLTIFSLLMAIGIVEIILPYVNEFANTQLTLTLTNNPLLIIVVFGIILFVGLFSGSYPSVILSKFNPLKILTSNLNSPAANKFSLNLRRLLVIFQFTISVFLILAAVTIYMQLQFIQDKKTGFNKEQIIILPISGAKAIDNFKNMKNELLSIPEIVDIGAASNIPGDRFGMYAVRIPGKFKPNIDDSQAENDLYQTRMIFVSPGYIEAFGMEMIEGRSFSDEFPSDENSTFIINEAAAKDFGLDNPVGTDLEYSYALAEPKKGKIIGVIKDFHYASLHSDVEALTIQILPKYFSCMSLKIKTKNIKPTINKIESLWSEMNPTVPFDFYFFDSYYDRLYQREMNMGKIMAYFTILAILIACLGLYGLVAFIIQQKTKEIGIRKVLGASIFVIMKKISKEFIILVAIANILAWVPAYYFISNWLDTFAYRINISFGIFASTTILALLIAIITISSKTFRAASINPVDSLKY